MTIGQRSQKAAETARERYSKASAIRLAGINRYRSELARQIRAKRAEFFMRSRNRASRNGDRELVVLVDGPEDNYAVMDLRSAIDAGFFYRWA